MFWKIIGALLVIWLAFTILGPVLTGLFWLAVIGVVLLGATAAYGAIKSKSQPKRIGDQRLR
ncbi:hypothetical protein SAMN06265360_11476 [Haloechinothrix alba]|uniref:LPXTG-motif cell wall anchor domain-containing protein n=1 Tax=Haloechinothrix alba TaxID=664784 RepID=A0A238Y9Z9_9PSEU|nr:hypothetical protein [Haloechinothrix alba]SNR67782.1 hypothetical protein SAMN06265360_11476 [Haloechinothrix alba]